MFSWNLMLQRLFGLRRQQPKARRSKKTVKLHLEALEDRALPSGSPLPVAYLASPPPVPSIAAVESYMMSAINQWSQFVVTVQQDILGYYQGLIQEAAQLESYAVQEAYHLFGINPNPPTQATNPVVVPPGSGMGRGNNSGAGSGASAPTTHTASNPPRNNSTQQSGSGSGSGSGSTTTTYGNASPPRITPMAGSGSGVNTFTWDPRAPTGTGSGSLGLSDNANLWWNWMLNGNPQSGPPGFKGKIPSLPTDIVVFNGEVSDDPINWDDPVISTMKLEFNAKNVQTINPGETIELTGKDAGGVSLYMDGTSSLNLKFSDASSKFQIDANGTITNMQLTGNSGGQFIIAGGTTRMAQSSSYTESLGVQFTINAGATVSDQSYTSIQLTADDLTLAVYGEMDFFYGPNNGINLIGGGANYPDDFIWVYHGFLGYYGKQDVIDTITIPIAVQNGGTFRVSVSGNSTGGKLIVQGNYHDPDFEDSSVYMEGSTSSVQLAYGDTLECDGGYKQVSGTLATTDASTCYLMVGAGGNGTATIAGGDVIINLSNSGYSKLFVNAATLNFNGLLEVAIDASNPDNSDWLGLDLNCTINLQASSTAEILVNNGTPAPGKQWVIIKGLSIPIQGNFSSIDVVPSTINLKGMLTDGGLEYIVKS